MTISAHNILLLLVGEHAFSTDGVCLQGGARYGVGVGFYPCEDLWKLGSDKRGFIFICCYSLFDFKSDLL